ncbi:MAG: hypothetical protein MI784_11350 [Cytophagales bacterium]|nr:hypothetical protein [Cytophagales bacterium]
MNIHRQLIFLFLLLLFTSCSSKKNTLNPTGTYHYNFENQNEYNAILLVKQEDRDSINVSFDLSTGAPYYHVGQFQAILPYENNKAVYGPLEIDSTCRIELNFDSLGVSFRQIFQENMTGYNCGFGATAYADSLYMNKVSSEIPAIE